VLRCVERSWRSRRCRARTAHSDEIIKADDKWWPKYRRSPREVRSFERQADRLSGSRAMSMAIRRVSSFVSIFACRASAFRT
jgi:hypothetical protein